MDSAGSCDSVISMNSGYSEDSMEHLSAEERACLMYLEETIEALEVQEDSGLSNDELDFGSQAEEKGRMRVNDFMDEQESPSQPEKVKELPPSARTSSNKPRATLDLELLRQRVYVKRTSTSSSVTEEPPSKPPADVTPGLTPPVVPSGPQTSPPPEAAESRGPPAVAPKPKKLPANIILKSHKAATFDGNSGHSVSTSTDRLLLDPQRVHMEALRKLGLLKSNEADYSPALSPKLSPKTRRSWAAPSPPVSPAASHTPPATPSYTNVNSPPPVLAPLQPASPAAVTPSATSPAPSAQPPDIVPAPAAFCDPVGPPPPDNELSAAKDVMGATVDTPPLTPPALVRQPTPPKVIGIKSATLERSGLGLSRFMAGQNADEAGQSVNGEQSPSLLRNNRPRTASLGGGTEFSSAQGEGLQAGHATSKEPDSRRSLPAHIVFPHSRESQKLPRSQGISVLICPRSENGENRREALKKLGLLRD
ncbi:specifically androgen-regulated gene protein-like [Brachyistius frenatus]|uniref:specifically androgen-regulated gene protein-like n=1 Tax=Brachyistius frenatus TaxID=100188 RepID=UPI0037E8F340